MLYFVTHCFFYKQAKQCIKTGQVFSWNWALENPTPPLFGRQAIQHKYIPHTDDDLAFDDCIDNFNPQASTQWDGLRHISQVTVGKFYNGVTPQEVTDGVSGRLGIQHMAERGIAGRAVLLDFARWAEEHRPDYNPLERQEITVEELQEVADAQGVTFKQGDILLVRVGWMAAYEKEGHRLAEMMDLTHPECAGVKACPETFKWVWDNHFAAVCSDNFPFEAFPPKWEESCRKSPFLTLRIRSF